MILLSSTKLRQWAISTTTPLPIYEMASRVFLEIYYDDLFGREHSAFYDVNTDDFLASGLGVRVSSEQADRIKKAFGYPSPHRPLYGGDPAEIWADMVIQEWPNLKDESEIMDYQSAETGQGQDR